MLTRREMLGVVGGAAVTGLAGLAGCGGHASSAPAVAPQGAAGPAPPPTAPAPTPPAAARFAALKDFCAGIQPIGPAEREKRQERARDLLRGAGFAALVLEAGPSMHYFAGGAWRRSERPLLMVLPVRGEPFFVGPAFEEGTLRESVVGAGELRLWHEHEDPYALAIAGLRERGGRGRIAVEQTVRLFISSGLARAGNGFTFENGAALVDACRMVKSPAELAILRRANEATKAAIQAAASHVARGMGEDDLADLLREAQETAGLTSIWALVAFGPNAAYPHGTRNRRPLAEGDLILVDTGGDLAGYQSDISRTWPFGTPGAEERRAFDTVLEAQRAAMELIRPGARCADVDAAARKVVASRGFGDAYQRFTHRLGHGIGLEGHEPPYLVRANDTRLRPGMTMSNEPGIYLMGRYGVRIEDIVAVTDGPAEVFGPRVGGLESPFGD
jgi:Xaa-Pro dipeptidase